MIKREIEQKSKIAAKGKLLAVNETGILLEDAKEFTKDLITLEELRTFVGKEISITLAESSKEEVDLFEAEDEDTDEPEED